MCNLYRKTKRKTVTVYKAVVLLGKTYYSPFSGMEVKLGKVEPQTPTNYSTVDYTTRNYHKMSQYYNPNMVGKSSGFAKREVCEKINVNYKRILKVVLGGEIWEGNSDGISDNINNWEVIYAGTEILSFEEVKNHQFL